jgi:spore coat protein U domain-containing protein, fimbrial subunit CupE1/2/3/6
MKFLVTIKSVLPAAIGALALGLGSTSIFAATVTTTFQVTANVQATCQISATAAAFGPYTGVVTDTTSIVTVTCSNTATYNIGLNAGLATGATVTNRSMTGPASSLLNYGLFQDAAHSINWGDTVGTDTVTGTGDGLAQTVTIFGQVSAGQFVQAGPYLDTITATITF